MGFEVRHDRSEEVISAKDAAIQRALETIGILAEKYAKALCPVGTTESTGQKGYRGGTLRNSITHTTKKGPDSTQQSVIIGSNVEYAPFVELGTGPYFNPPPDWEGFSKYSKKGGGHGYVKPRPYLKPAITDHISEFKKIVENELH